MVAREARTHNEKKMKGTPSSERIPKARQQHAQDEPAAGIGGLKVQEDIPRPNYNTLQLEENRIQLI